MNLDEHARTFEAERGALVGLAYRLTGSRAEAEDVAQDAFLRWRKVDPADVEDPHAYLATIVTRLCLDRMKSARARREIYVGPWLPERSSTRPWRAAPASWPKTFPWP